MVRVKVRKISKRFYFFGYWEKKMEYEEVCTTLFLNEFMTADFRIVLSGDFFAAFAA